MIDGQIQDFHEKLRFGTILAGIGGFLDVYTFILHNGVFANAQTGNIVLIGISLANERGVETLKYLYPILAFMLGVFFSELIRRNRKAADWATFILGIEAAAFLAMGFLPESTPDICITTVISFISSVQIASFTKLRSSPYSTTMMTGNLRSSSEFLFNYIKTRDREYLLKSARYAAVILSFIMGAGLGALLVKAFAARSIWICSALQIVLIVQLIAGKPGNARSTP